MSVVAVQVAVAVISSSRVVAVEEAVEVAVVGVVGVAVVAVVAAVVVGGSRVAVAVAAVAESIRRQRLHTDRSIDLFRR